MFKMFARRSSLSLFLSFDLGLVLRFAIVLEKYLKIRLLIEIQLIPISLFKNIIINKKKRSQILSSAYINTPSGKVHN